MGVDAGGDWRSDLGEALVGEAALRARVEELARLLTADYAGRNPLVVGVLCGAFMFLADLVRRLDFPLEITFVRAASYGDAACSSRAVSVTDGPREDLHDRDVILVEDIVDTGHTLAALVSRLREQRPRSLAVCCLLDKTTRREAPVEVQYRGFEIPDEFVVGYGLDYAGRYRHLPFVATLKPEAYQGGPRNP